MLTLARITPEHFDIIFLNENHDWCSLTFFTCFQKIIVLNLTRM